MIQIKLIKILQFKKIYEITKNYRVKGNQLNNNIKMK